MIVEEGIFTIAHTNSAAQTLSGVLADWLIQFQNDMPDRYVARVENNKLYVELREYFAFMTVPSMSNCTMIDVKKRLTFNSEDNGNLPQVQ